MRLQDDSGISLAEMMVVTLLMGFVMVVGYMGIQFGYRARDVAEAQSGFSQSVTAPLNVMDASFSQRVPVSGWAMDPYICTVRMPSRYRTDGIIEEHEYSATTAGTLVQRVFRVSGASRTLVRTVQWSDDNVNRATNEPLFRYFTRVGAASVAATNSALVDSVLIKISSRINGQDFSDSRLVYLRNQ